MKKRYTKFQIDEIVLVLIVAVIAMVISIFDNANSPRMDAEKITAMVLDGHELSFVSNGVIDESKLAEVQNINYEELKDLLNVRNDFCLYIEDGDGKIILSKGASMFNGDGIYCRE